MFNQATHRSISSEEGCSACKPGVAFGQLALRKIEENYLQVQQASFELTLRVHPFPRKYDDSMNFQQEGLGGGESEGRCHRLYIRSRRGHEIA